MLIDDFSSQRVHTHRKSIEFDNGHCLNRHLSMISYCQSEFPIDSFKR